MTIEIADCDWITGDALEMQTTSLMERFGREVRRAGTFYIVPQFTRTPVRAVALRGRHSKRVVRLPVAREHAAALSGARSRAGAGQEDRASLPPATMTAMPFAGPVKNGLLACWWYASRMDRSTFPGVLTLCYHGIRESGSDDGDDPLANLHVVADTVADQIRMIAQTCHPIDLPAFCDSQTTGHVLPARPVLITFDDGYRSVFELARRYGVPAAVFVCSGPVQRQRLFSFDAVARAIGPDLFHALREQPDEAWRRAAAKYDVPASDAPQLAPMADTQVRQLADEGFSIGVHTASHAALGKAPADVQRRELESCRAAIESWTGRPVDALAYPFGTPAVDYTEETVAIAASLGFRAGFTTRPGFARAAKPTLERSRFVVLGAVTAAELAHRITYTWPR
jgi:peptidoglycan/xylan/chitin deacetylase (PgdA/CDA1 family)